ncbi:hypothetical protein [Halalkalibacter akibai]|uniref:Uncharacterized protein n=1 Tax=Halalkalibacter akibai (strain ATCC 43226 / DSM 21942 / CIP 109018 / JCM 9157 / 1139) TaxID=1236973 RepID=W4QZU1_HALA3|nr:hypothetical protein [Halalkalibacter akibai]GAE36834.1 hypothetical protein JCM9157_4055 [Halalkalibacter akibai JCM 9157]
MFDSEEHYLDEIEKYKKYSTHEDLLLILAKRGHYEAKTKLGQSKQELLVVSIALGFLAEGLPFLDLIREGNVGLNKGLEDIKTLSEGTSLNAFLTPYITSSIKKSLSQ